MADPAAGSIDGAPGLKPSDPASLNARFARDSGDAVLPGDRIGRSVVEGFVCTRMVPGEATGVDDLVVLSEQTVTGSHRLPVRESRALRTATTGRRPILQVDPENVSEPSSESVQAEIVAQMERIQVDTYREGNKVRTSGAQVLEDVAGDGYDVWLVGGMVRDTLMQVSPDGAARAAADLDVVGSIPPGTFSDRIGEFIGRAEIPTRFNPGSGVVAVFRDPAREHRLLEYAPLKGEVDPEQHSFTFGSDPRQDASWRDLTINTVAYDWRSKLLIDPTGQGLGDIDRPALRPPGEPKRWPCFLGRNFFRYLKFMDRLPQADTATLGPFVERNFDQVREDVEMLAAADLKRCLEPLGDSPGERLDRAAALARRLAPSCNWTDLFAVVRGAVT